MKKIFESLSLSLYIYIYIYLYLSVCIFLDVWSNLMNPSADMPQILNEKLGRTTGMLLAWF